MTERFRVADSKEKVLTNASDKILAFLESKGDKNHKVAMSPVDVSFTDTNSVDTVLASNYYYIPSLSKERTCLRQNSSLSRTLSISALLILMSTKAPRHYRKMAPPRPHS